VPVFTPGNTALVSDQHAELVSGLRSLLERMTRATPEERAILKMSIDLLEYLHDYATGIRRQTPPSFTIDEFIDQLICSGGLEVHDGRIVPRF
jgi:hypothetical protein